MKFAYQGREKLHIARLGTESSDSCCLSLQSTTGSEMGLALDPVREALPKG